MAHDDDMGELWLVPGAQELQDVAPVFEEYFPAKQGRQETDPSDEAKVPAEQLVHRVAPG